MEKSDSAPSSNLPRNAISDVPYTILGQTYGSDKRPSWKAVDKGPLHWKIQITAIKLEQDPSETLDLEMHLESIPAQDPFEYLYKITNMEINFQNKLHEFDKNYVYEVLCRYSTEDTDPDEYLFSFAKRRLSSAITVTKKCFSAPELLRSSRLYIYIRRTYRLARENEMRRYRDFDSLLQNAPRDIKLVVGDQRLYAHQLVLSHSSDVFKSKLSSAKTDEVVIEKFSVEVIEEMLNFLYTGKIEDIEMRYELLKVAREYQLEDLHNRCIEYIIFNVESKNIAKTIEIADLYNIKLLKDSAKKFVENYAQEISNEPSYCDYLCRVIKLGNAADTLIFADKYKIEKVTRKALNFISNNYDKMRDKGHFDDLYESNNSLMIKIVNYYCKKHGLCNEKTQQMLESIRKR